VQKHTPETISRCVAAYMLHRLDVLVCRALFRRLTRLPIKSSVSWFSRVLRGFGLIELASKDGPAAEKSFLPAAKAVYPKTWRLHIAERQHGKSIQ